MSKDALNICTMVLSAWGRDSCHGAPPSDAWWWGINITLPPPPPWPLAGVKGNNRMQLRLPVWPLNFLVEGSSRVSRGNQPGHREWAAGNREPFQEGMRLLWEDTAKATSPRHSLYSPIRLPLQNTNSKVIIKTFKITAPELSFLSRGSLWVCMCGWVVGIAGGGQEAMRGEQYWTSHVPVKPAWL